MLTMRMRLHQEQKKHTRPQQLPQGVRLASLKIQGRQQHSQGRNMRVTTDKMQAIMVSNLHTLATMVKATKAHQVVSP